MDQFPLVSICIPIYNCGNYLKDTLNCLFEQTYSNIEIIAVDDGSTDNSLQILKEAGDPRLTFYTQSNKGAASARNKAFKRSSGSMIKFMDGDDLINKECISLQLDRILGEENAIASSSWFRFYNNNLKDIRIAPEKVWKDLPGIDWLIESLVDTGGNMMQPGIFLIPRTIVEKAGSWNENLSLIDDFEYMVRILCNSELVIFCSDATLYYRSGNSNHLSARKAHRDMESALESVTLSCDQILSVKNNEKSRLACANTFQRWALQFYPNFPDLCAIAESKARQLGGASIGIFGGKAFKALATLVGWKFAKRIKIFITGRDT